MATKLGEMKQETNNEMDLMLRKLGRTVNTVSASQGNGTQGSSIEVHLDSDELNAFAENALPAAARARYTEHLAECTRCRQIVSQLSLASGRVIEEKSVVVPATSGILAFLLSLLSPAVLRYAMPALALIAVASIGLVVFRQGVLTKRQQLSRASPAVAENTEQPVLPGQVAIDSYANRQSSAPREEVAKNKSGETQSTEGGAKTFADDSGQAKAGKAEEPVTATDQVAANRGAPTSSVSVDVAAATPKPAAAPAMVEDKKETGAEAAKRNSQPLRDREEVEATRANEKELAKTRAKEPAAAVGGFSAVTQSGPAKAKLEAGEARGQRAERNAESDRQARADKDEPETKSVAGHRFRKEGSVWIDVNFKSSQAIVNVARSSEQYRALVADEPEIRTIADQLAGEVIVVLKGRAYRIK